MKRRTRRAQCVVLVVPSWSITVLMSNLWVGILAVIALLIVPPAAQAEVTAERTKHGVAIKIDGKPFTEYHTKAGHSPALWPVIGPTRTPVTRSYPFTGKDQTDDHPHHQ